VKNQLSWVWERRDWPKWRWDTSSLSPALARARGAQGEAIGRAKLLIPSLDARAHGEFLVQEGLNTSAIEGEQLDVGALRSSIASRLGLPIEPNAASPAPRNVEGLIDVLQDATEKYLEPLTLKKLNSWQAALFPTGRSGLHEIHVGQLRGPEPMRIVSGPLHKERVHYEAPPRTGLDEQMQVFLHWFNEESAELDGLIRAGIAHLWFEVLHPYDDGNGRVGRAILDLALAQDEKRSMRVYSLSAQLYRVRDDYYAALERASRGSLDATAWLEFFLLQVTEAAESSEKAIGTVLDEARFWMAHGGQPLNERQRKAVNLMLDKGRGGFEGGMTNAKYARLTKASPATAQRDLADLVGVGMLALVGAGRAARYEVQWDDTRL
jgi:Fic family protein